MNKKERRKWKFMMAVIIILLIICFVAEAVVLKEYDWVLSSVIGFEIGLFIGT